MTAMQWFFTFLKKYRGKLILALFLVTITSTIAIINPQIAGIVVDQIIEGGNRELLPVMMTIMIVATFTRAVVKYCFLIIFEKSSQGLLYNMRDYVYRRLLAQDFNFYNKNRTGDLMSRQTGDMDAIRHFVAYVIYGIYENTLLFVIALVMIFLVDWRLALCMIAVLPLTALTTAKQLKAVKPAFHNIRQHFSSLNTFVQENVSGNRVVKAFAKEDYEIEKFNKENDGFREAELNAARTWRKYVPIFEFLANSLSVILYLVGGIMVVNGHMSLGKMVTVSGYLWMLNMPLRQAGWLANDYQRFVTSVEKIYSTVIVEPTIQPPVNAITKKRFKGDIVFSHVSYNADDEVILTDVNFHVMPGQTVGIIGATGSGKSTLMNLLCRFYDVTSGEITIDGINVKNLDLFSIRDNIGMAMQDVFLFSDTIEGNIAYGRPDCSFEEVEAVAKIANAHDFIMEMPDGYDTIVGERGVGLSGGQKQRISLARALLKDPSIIILDDTTSAVDMETETQIQSELSSLNEKHTVFIIAHRISSIKDADQILVVDNGRIIESGNHEELLEKKGYYYTVFHHQYGDFDNIRKYKSTVNREQKSMRGGR
ncbi:ABC transporter ATP-binding protein [Lachnospiraceae bacterium MD1]|jgi:ATP-binding cassette subfamily B protein|uniref:ABC transporter ATP-binding protein n=1 Tax=Variimorphobacter saccharofermentans TaxID=2755051 RepID=A0A839JXV1_9FIRM|nr:ABC transporter ATP-binding protein [Variimorphobacter saccharofermentans]MBB2182236.1 ABC transporter ATP-binding protein [Variimorphobacter saccharofermentans]